MKTEATRNEQSAVRMSFQEAMHVTLRVASLQLMELTNQPNEEGFDLTRMPGRIKAHLTDATVPKILSAAILQGCNPLLKQAGTSPFVTKDKDAEIHLPLPMADLMDTLAGAWAALYLHGMPFPHLWEPVARHAERNGFFRGASLFKAAGDIYRDARRSLPRTPAAGPVNTESESVKHPPSGGAEPPPPEKAGPPPPPAPRTGAPAPPDRKDETGKPAAAATAQNAGADVLLLDHNPLAIRHFIDLKPASGQQRLVQAALGACYELMQLRLYIREGGSIDHLVSAHGIRRRLQGAATSAEKAKRDGAGAGKTPTDEEIRQAKEDAIEASIQDMWKLACLTYGGAYPSGGDIPFARGQRILIVTLEREDERLPGCVLSRNRTEDGWFHAAAITGLILKPKAAARRCSAAMLR